MRNKRSFALIAAGMLWATAVFAAGPQVAANPECSDNVTFTDTITSVQCNSALGNEDITVLFGPISHRSQKTTNSAFTSKVFTMRLLDCAFDPVLRESMLVPMGLVSFRGTLDTGNNTVHTGSGTATNVGVQLLDSNKTTPITPNTEMAYTDTWQQSNWINTLNSSANLINTGAVDSGIKHYFYLQA